MPGSVLVVLFLFIASQARGIAMGSKTVDIVIPTKSPQKTFRDLLLMLEKQSCRPGHILIINTGEEEWDESWVTGISNIEVFHITQQEFDHAATRNKGAGFSNADYLLFMTQDAVPADEYLIENLLKHFDNPLIKTVYARQLPNTDCRIDEGFVRMFNYPSEDAVHRIEDVGTLGVKAFFCSNVCACYEHRLFRQMKGFSAPAIFNEDMVYAGRIMNLGYSVYYAADARVFHSHNYSAAQQFHRNFDNGVSQAMHPEIFGRIRSEGEGRRLVKYVSEKLWDTGRIYLIPRFLLHCAARLGGFMLGKRFRKMPRWAVRSLSMNKGFWRNGIPEDPEF